MACLFNIGSNEWTWIFGFSSIVLELFFFFFNWKTLQWTLVLHIPPCGLTLPLLVAYHAPSQWDILQEVIYFLYFLQHVLLVKHALLAAQMQLLFGNCILILCKFTGLLLKAEQCTIFQYIYKFWMCFNKYNLQNWRKFAHSEISGFFGAHPLLQLNTTEYVLLVFKVTSHKISPVLCGAGLEHCRGNLPSSCRA